MATYDRDPRLQYHPSPLRWIGPIVGVLLVAGGAAAYFLFFASGEAPKEEEPAAAKPAAAEPAPAEKPPAAAAAPAAAAPAAAPVVDAGPAPENITLDKLSDSRAIKAEFRADGRGGFVLTATSSLKQESTLTLVDCVALLSDPNFGLIELSTEKIPQEEKTLKVSADKSATCTFAPEAVRLVGFHLTEAEMNQLRENLMKEQQAKAEAAAGAAGGEAGAAPPPPGPAPGMDPGAEIKVPSPLASLPSSVTVTELGPAVKVEPPPSAGPPAGAPEAMAMAPGMAGPPPGPGPGMPGTGTDDLKTKTAKEYYTWRKTQAASLWSQLESELASQPEAALTSIEEQLAAAPAEKQETATGLAAVAANPYARAELGMRLRGLVRAWVVRAAEVLAENAKRPGSLDVNLIQRAWQVCRGKPRPHALGADWQAAWAAQLTAQAHAFFAAYDALTLDQWGPSPTMDVISQTLARGNQVLALAPILRPDSLASWTRKHEGFCARAVYGILNWARQEMDGRRYTAVVSSVQAVLGAMPDIPEKQKLDKILADARRLAASQDALAKGQAAVSAGNYTEALGHFQQAAADRDSPFRDEAVKQIDDVKAKINKDADDLLRKAQEQESAQTPHAAYQTYTECLRKYPKSDQAKFIQGRLDYLKTSVLDKAAQELSQIKSLLAQEKFRECREAINRLEAMGSDLPEQSEVPQLKKNLDQAIDKACVRLRARAKNQETLGRKDRARELWQELLDLAPQSKYATEAQQALQRLQ